MSTATRVAALVANIDTKEGTEIMSSIGRLPPPEQAAALAVEGVVWTLARNKGSAKPMICLIEKLARAEQTQILAVGGAVMALADKGCATRVMTVIAKLPPDEQTRVLSSRAGVKGLAENGKARRVVALLENLTCEQQAAVLVVDDAVGSLARYVPVQQVLDLISALTPEQRASMLAARGSVVGLVNAGLRMELENILTEIAELVRSVTTGRARTVQGAPALR